MFRGDRVTIDSDLISQESSASFPLGMESRSILKSISTEESKLVQSSSITRSDLHYFRARFNYYRLSLMRLPQEERGHLEPVLIRFLGCINEREASAEKGSPSVGATPNFSSQSSTKVSNPPFLAPVERPVERPIEKRAQEMEPEMAMIVDTKESLDWAQEIISELMLVKLAIQADLNPETKKILEAGMDRAISKLKLLSKV